MSSIPLKRCSMCGEEKPATSEYFSPRKRKEGMLYAHCRECGCERSRMRREANPERERARVNRYRAENPEKVRESNRRYRTENREKINAYYRNYYSQNTEKVLESTRRYAAEHPEVRRKASKNYRLNHPEKPRIATQRRRALKRAAAGCHTPADIRDQYIRQRGRCYYCGCTLNDNYQIDHVVPLTRGGSNDMSNIVVTCPTCNQSKNNKLPHEWAKGGRLL